MKPLQVNKNNVVRIILGTKSLEDSTKLNYNLLGIFSDKQLYLIKTFIRNKTNMFSFSKSREHKIYNLHVIYYTKKSFGKSIVDYLDTNYFNQSYF